MPTQRRPTCVSLLPTDLELIERLQDDRTTRTTTKVMRAALAALARERGLAIVATEEPRKAA